MEENNNQKESLNQTIIDFWEKNNIFEKSLNKPDFKGDYRFYDGPPFATGTPHYGHIVANVIKDVVPRYWTMKGYHVERKWGWDCHGLPIENIVEKELNTKNKKDIEEYGIDKFNNLCRTKVLEYSEEWYKVMKKLGRWADMKNPYRTMDLNFMESVWWVFKQLWDKDLIYEGYRSMHICPRCETTLSQSEVTEGYRDIKDLSCIAKFELINEPGTFVLAWTTTPWTLIGNVALAVGEDIEYIKIKNLNNNEFYILAKERQEALKEANYEITESFKGSDLIGKKYKPLFDYYANDEKLENKDNGWKIYGADFVTTTDGTGVVHIAPAFGEDDLNLGKKYNLPFVQHVGMDGNFKIEVKDENLKGLNVKPKDDHTKTDVEIIKYLANKNLLFAKEKYEHSYPHCWRCDTPLINYATSSWFVNVLKIKNELLENAKKINWSPDYIKEGRFGNWLEGARDWSISRQRFWASVLPIWKCSCGEIKVFGSIADLEKASGEKITDLHKDFIDPITVPCEKCGEKMKRIPDVLDCWFESGSMPYAQLHYPFENKEKFENGFPAEFIAEGADQTRAWFYYLHVIAGGIKNNIAFKNVIVNGIVLAEDGKKMSKKLKNYPDPTLVLEKYGADALRMYLLSSPVTMAENLNFKESGVEESLRKNIMILNNIFKFYEMYAEENIDLKNINNVNFKIIDKWLLLKLNELLKNVEKAMNNYDLPRAVRPITEFLDDFSTWYIRRSRDRFKGDDLDDKEVALKTTGYTLITLAKIIAPFMPFISENLWQKINHYNFTDTNKSIHLEAWPEAINLNFEENILPTMEKIREIVAISLAKRDEAGIKIRQILNSLTIKIFEKNTYEPYAELIKEEVNVEEVIFEEINDKNLIDINLDTNIDESLKLKGGKREIVRFVNLIRKDAGLSINDRIKICYNKNDQEIKKIIDNFSDEIKKETLSTEIIEIDNFSEIEFKKDIKIENNKNTLGIIII